MRLQLGKDFNTILLFSCRSLHSTYTANRAPQFLLSSLNMKQKLRSLEKSWHCTESTNYSGEVRDRGQGKESNLSFFSWEICACAYATQTHIFTQWSKKMRLLRGSALMSVTGNKSSLWDENSISGHSFIRPNLVRELKNTCTEQFLTQVCKAQQKRTPLAQTGEGSESRKGDTEIWCCSAVCN